MQCELVYFFVSKASLDKIVRAQACAAAENIVMAVSRSVALEDQAVDGSELKAQIEELAETMVRESDRRMWDALGLLTYPH